MGNPQDLFRLDGRHVAVTGASSGFGSHFAGVLTAAGARVSLGARRLDRIEARTEELQQQGSEAKGHRLDVLDGDSIAAFLDGAAAAFGPIDVLINNAGVESGPKTFAMIDEDDWDRVLDTNLKAAWRVSTAYTERVERERGGNIVNVSSMTAFRHTKGQFPYAVSKAGLNKLTEVMAAEAARYGIRVNALAPGYVLTEVSRVLLESESSDTFRKLIPMRRYGDFEDLDGPLLLLASDASRYMTGSVVVVDGGLSHSSLL